MNGAFIELLGFLLDGLAELSASTQPVVPVARIPRISERYVAKGRVQLPGAVVTSDGTLSGRFIATLSTGDIVRVEAISSTGPKALLVIDEIPLSATGVNIPAPASAQHSLIVTFRALEQQFDLL